MKYLFDFIKRLKWSYNVDRLGPDIISTYLMMFSPLLAKRICEKKFKKFGKCAEVRHGAVIIGCSNISLGDYVCIRPGAYIAASIGEVIIEDKVLLASGVQIHTTNHKFDNIEIPIYDQGFTEPSKIIIKSGAWVAANAVILPGVTIGKNSVIAAGSIVNRSVPDNTVVAGVPAKVIRKIGNNKEV